MSPTFYVYSFFYTCLEVSGKICPLFFISFSFLFCLLFLIKQNGDEGRGIYCAGAYLVCLLSFGFCMPLYIR